MADRPIHCTIKNPVLLNIADSKNEFHSGCRVVDINFPNVTNPEVGEIQFKNNYVAYLTIRVKQKSAPPENGGEPTPEIKWKTCLRRMRLMPNPHCEAGSQDYYCVSRKHFLFDLNNLTAMRLILQQPSPVWKDFRLEEIKLFRSSEANRPPPLPAWLIEEANNSTGKKKIEYFDSTISYLDEDSHEELPPLKNGGNLPRSTEDNPRYLLAHTGDQTLPGIGSVDAISASLQQLWALSEEVAANQTHIALGRFDVDGCYEINLLSYT